MTSFTSSSTDLKSPDEQAPIAAEGSGGFSTGGQLRVGYIDPDPNITGHGLAAPEEQAHTAPPRVVLRGHRRIEGTLLQKAKDIVDSIDPRDAFQTPLHLTALAGVVMEMWESAADSTDIHQEVLATLENGVRLRRLEGAVANEDLSVFREALTDLEQEHLARENADVVRSRFVRRGFGPLGFVDEDSDNTADAND